jgi:hypothetical protein
MFRQHNVLAVEDVGGTSRPPGLPSGADRPVGFLIFGKQDKRGCQCDESVREGGDSKGTGQAQK